MVIIIIIITTHFGGSPEGERGCRSRVLWDERWCVRGGRLLYFSDFSCSFVVVFLFPISFVFFCFVLYYIFSFITVFLYCIVCFFVYCVLYCIMYCIVLLL